MATYQSGNLHLPSEDSTARSTPLERWRTLATVMTTIRSPPQWLSVLACGAIALLTTVGIAAAVGRAMHPEDLTAVVTRVADPVRAKVFAALGLEDPLLAERPAEVARVDSRFAAHPRTTLLHVVPGGLFLLIAPLQFSSWIRRRHVRFHRWSGRFLVLIAVVSTVPGLFFGLVIPYAGLVESAAIALFGGLFLVALVRAVLAIRRGEVARHREWMIRAFAVALAIATVRVVAIALDIALTPAGIRPPALFALSVWTGWVLTVGAAELWILATRSRTSSLPAAAAGSR